MSNMVLQSRLFEPDLVELLPEMVGEGCRVELVLVIIRSRFVGLRYTNQMVMLMNTKTQ